jgi:hypothetical protein
MVSLESGAAAIDIYFSYHTAVAFRINGTLAVIRNYWGTTIGKHLNWIDSGNAESRLTQTEFETGLTAALRYFAELSAESAFNLDNESELNAGFDLVKVLNSAAAVNQGESE